MAAHISAWERFEDWLASEQLAMFPLTHDKILKYALALDQKECGPSVLPSFRTSVKWVTSKLAIECPDLAHPALLAVQAEIVKKRNTTLKEAVPIPIAAVACLELFVVDPNEPDAARLFAWWWLCMVFASLRFDDALHVKPQELVLTDQGLFGIAWQTKVERRRRGTKFVVPHVGFKDSAWLETGWELLLLENPDRDYWMRDLNSREEFRDAPASYPTINAVAANARPNCRDPVHERQSRRDQCGVGPALRSDSSFGQSDVARRCGSRRPLHRGDRPPGELEEPWSFGA